MDFAKGRGREVKELDFLKRMVKEAYENCCDGNVVVSAKAAFDVVTNVDHAIERYFAKELEKEFPGDHLLGEEFSSDLGLSDRTWILDPIDGTYNFSIGACHFGVQAAFFDKGQLQASAIYFPVLNELYTAERGKGAFCNGKKISVSSREPKDAIISFGDPSHLREGEADIEWKMMQSAFGSIARYRMYGASCVDFSYLASGKTEGTVLITRNKWDLAPGLLLAKEAGAKLFALDGGEYDFSARGVIACNKKEIFDILTENKG